MAGVSYATAVALALVFAAAGTAKLRRRTATARAFAALGLASPRALAVGVPAVELILAAGLLVVPSWASIAALAVLAGFSTFVVAAIRRGEVQGCGCFGSSRPQPMGGGEVARNALLAGAAAVAAIGSDPVVPGLGAVALVGAAAGSGVIVVRRVAARHPSPGPRQGPRLGSLAPPLPGPDTSTADGAGVNLVAFVAPSCDGCDGLRAAMTGYRERSDVILRLLELDDDSAPTFAAFGVIAPPFLVVLDAEGIVRGAGPARRADDIDRLLDDSS